MNLHKGLPQKDFRQVGWYISVRCTLLIGHLTWLLPIFWCAAPLQNKRANLWVLVGNHTRARGSAS